MAPFQVLVFRVSPCRLKALRFKLVSRVFSEMFAVYRVTVHVSAQGVPENVGMNHSGIFCFPSLSFLLEISSLWAQPPA